MSTPHPARRTMSTADLATAAEVRRSVDAAYPRTNPDGSINAAHVAMEQTLRERHGLPSYLAHLDGPGRFRQAPIVLHMDPRLRPWRLAYWRFTLAMWRARWGVKVYRDPADWWVGYYRGPHHGYVCLLPTIVIRWVARR